MTGTKNSQLPKIFGSLPADHTKKFLKFGHSSKSFQPKLLTEIANQLSLLTKKYLTSKVRFDIIYLKMTENARSVTTENTLVIKLDIQKKSPHVETFFVSFPILTQIILKMSIPMRVSKGRRFPSIAEPHTDSQTDPNVPSKLLILYTLLLLRILWSEPNFAYALGTALYHIWCPKTWFLHQWKC